MASESWIKELSKHLQDVFCNEDGLLSRRSLVKEIADLAQSYVEHEMNKDKPTSDKAQFPDEWTNTGNGQASPLKSDNAQAKWGIEASEALAREVAIHNKTKSEIAAWMRIANERLKEINALYVQIRKLERAQSPKPEPQGREPLVTSIGYRGFVSANAIDQPDISKNEPDPDTSAPDADAAFVLAMLDFLKQKKYYNSEAAQWGRDYGKREMQAEVGDIEIKCLAKISGPFKDAMKRIAELEAELAGTKSGGKLDKYISRSKTELQLELEKWCDLAKARGEKCVELEAEVAHFKTMEAEWDCVQQTRDQIADFRGALESCIEYINHGAIDDTLDTIVEALKKWEGK